MIICDKKMDRTEIERMVGHLSQIGGTRHYSLAEGGGRGVRAIDFDTGTGLVFTVLPDRGMDISRASYKGVNLVYRGDTGEVPPAYCDEHVNQSLSSFCGGLLTTYGLGSWDPPCGGAGHKFGLHGRLGGTRAYQVADTSDWVDPSCYELKVTGTLDGVGPGSEHLRMTRSICAKLGEQTLKIHDSVTNTGHTPAPLTILYHINAGYPLLSDQASLHVPLADCTLLEQQPALDAPARDLFALPRAGRIEQVFVYQFEQRQSAQKCVALVNPAAGDDGLGICVRFDARQLPYFMLWKFLRPGGYVAGLEPANVPCEGRAKLADQGLLPSLAPGETREFSLQIDILEGRKELENVVKSSGACNEN